MTRFLDRGSACVPCPRRPSERQWQSLDIRAGVGMPPFRFLALSLLFVALSACRLPPDQAPLRPLPEEGQVYTYQEIIGRARVQAQVALEAFYVDNWADLEEVARGLEQSARFLPKTSEVPLKHKDKLPLEAAGLGQDAVRLRDAARAKNVNQANETLQQIHFKIRSLRPDPLPAPKEPVPE